MTSEGKCIFCDKMLPKTSLNKHFAKHIKENEKTGKPGISYLLKVVPNPRYNSLPYFLYLWVNGNATIKDIDIQLRAIWLECCGHMSSFTDKKEAGNRRGMNMFSFFEADELLQKGKTKKYENLMEDTNGEIPFRKKVKDVFYEKQIIEYEYDFGSSTLLEITVSEIFNIAADKKVVLLSRNEPLEIMCEVCKKEPATQICTIHNYDEDSLFCDKCGKKHKKSCPDFDDYAGLPVVNSPRMGVCAYEEGTIDRERDGVFVKKETN